MDAKGNTETDVLARRVARLTAWVIGLTLLWLATVAWVALRRPSIPKVLSAERLEIREPNGNLAFVLANSKRPGIGTIDGELVLKNQEEQRQNPNFVFYDGKGSEVGGMMFATEETPDGPVAVRYFAMDAYKQDQTVAVGHVQDPGGASAGLNVWDRPWDITPFDAMAKLGLEPPVTKEELYKAFEAIPEEERAAKLRELFEVDRLFVGSTPEGDAELKLRDGQGRPRIVLQVPKEGDPTIRVLDEEGDPVLQLPETE